MRQKHFESKKKRWGNWRNAIASQPVAPQSGQALVEFALILPILMLIIVGVFEFGLAYFDAGKIDYTTREVARHLAICANACDAKVTLSGGQTGSADAGSVNGQLDVRDLDAIANQENSGPSNASQIDPSLIRYVWIQRTNADGYPIPITRTATGQMTWDTTTTTNKDYRTYFDYYVYDPTWKTDGYAAPFVPTSSCAADDPWLLNNEYSSGNVSGYVPYTSTGLCTNWRSDIDPSYGNNGGTAGRNVCEPTDSYWVEIGYKHYWITPLIPWAKADTRDTDNAPHIFLKSRIKMKVEPQFFAQQSTTTNTRNPNCGN